MARSVRLVALVLTLLAAGCQREAFNWEQPENVLVSKTAVEQPDGSVEMRFVSLMNVPAEHLFNALADVERHAEFIDGVTESKLVTTEGKKKIIDITNNVLGRPNRARIEWTIDPPTRTISFRTLEAEFTDNSAQYKIESSPDGKRARVTTVYELRDKGGHPFPLYSLKTGIEDSYVAAVRGVKRRALGAKAVVGPAKEQ